MLYFLVKRDDYAELDNTRIALWCFSTPRYWEMKNIRMVFIVDSLLYKIKIRQRNKLKKCSVDDPELFFRFTVSIAERRADKRAIAD